MMLMAHMSSAMGTVIPVRAGPYATSVEACTPERVRVLRREPQNQRSTM